MRNDSEHRDLDVITRDELLDNHFFSAYDAVSSLHSNWLNTRGPDSFRSPSKVWVYLDNVRMGGVESLSAIATMPVSFIQHYDGLFATQRWGVGHSAGVIYVATHPIPPQRSLQ
jgi:hypothetical protein